MMCDSCEDFKQHMTPLPETWLSSGPPIAPYTELAQVIRHLPILLRGTRRARRLSLRQAGQQMGVDFNVLGRIENGKDYNSRILSTLLEWMQE